MTPRDVTMNVLKIKTKPDAGLVRMPIPLEGVLAIEFVDSRGLAVQVRFTDHGNLDVMAMEGILLVLPRAANYVTIRTEPL